MIHQKTDLSYFAGYLDGDGCFYINFVRWKRLKPKPIAAIVITSVNNAVLYHFKRLFGGTVCLINKAHDNSKALYQLTIRKRNIQEFCFKLKPYLVEKGDQCDLLIQFMETNDNQIQQSLINRMNIIKDSEYLVSKYHKQEFEPLRNTIKPTIEDFAYLAGFIDAECCLGISKYKPKNKPNYTYKILLQCNNTKYPVFKWLLERFGGTIHFVNKLKYQKARKNQLTWRISGRALSRILPDIYPFLIHKKPVCEQLITFYKTTLPNGGAHHTNKFRHDYDLSIKIREDIVKKIHQLNSKGLNP